MALSGLLCAFKRMSQIAQQNVSEINTLRRKNAKSSNKSDVCARFRQSPQIFIRQQIQQVVDIAAYFALGALLLPRAR